MYVLTLVLEGLFQRYTKPHARFSVQRTADSPTKSAVAGMCAAAKGLTKTGTPMEDECLSRFLADFSQMPMAVRIDRPGEKLIDFHTVSSAMRAEGKISYAPGRAAVVNYHEYLCGASFTVFVCCDDDALDMLEDIRSAFNHPVFPVYLGTKCCIPSARVCSSPPTKAADVFEVVSSTPLRRDKSSTKAVEVIFESSSEIGRTLSHDVPESFPVDAVDGDGLRARPGIYRSRYVRSKMYDGNVFPLATSTTASSGYPKHHERDASPAWDKIRDERFRLDQNGCVFCGDVPKHAHHVTYENLGRERIEDLRSLCVVCHEAVTIIEDGAKMGVSRIDPCDPRWTEEIERHRAMIINSHGRKSC